MSRNIFINTCKIYLRIAAWIPVGRYLGIATWVHVGIFPWIPAWIPVGISLGKYIGNYSGVAV